MARQGRSAEWLAAVMDGEAAIEMRGGVDPGASIATASRAGVELEQAAIELDDVVVANGAPVLEAANGLEDGGRGCRLPRWLGLCRGKGEAGIVAWEKPVQHALRLGQGARLSQAEFDDQAILEGATRSASPRLAPRTIAD